MASVPECGPVVHALPPRTCAHCGSPISLPGPAEIDAAVARDGYAVLRVACTGGALLPPCPTPSVTGLVVYVPPRGAGR
jgi:hypothetical protein